MSGRSVYLETFGCQMNELDSELVAGRLRQLGYTFTGDAGAADVVLYNTCSVRERAEQKVWSRLGELKRVKRERPGIVVGVLGCLAERDGAAMIDRYPVVDVLCGPGELDKLPGLIDNAVRTKLALADGPERRAGRLTSAEQVALQGSTSRRSATLAAAADDLELLDLSRAISPVDSAASSIVRGEGDEPLPRASAYVRITRGCNKFCTYCVVPFTRGAEVHRPPGHIVDECKRLADAGVIEVTLLGQTVNHYRFEASSAVTVDGVTQPQKGRTYKGSHHRDALSGREGVTTFADLLYRIHEEVPAIKRLRFVTSYPRDFGDDVLDVMRACPRICRYIHAPAQSGSDRVLKLMNRGYSVSEYEEFVARCRERLDEPGIGRPLMLSGDIIVGFPTETDEDFAGTVRLVEQSGYKNCFIFKYSPRPGTSAFDTLADDVPEAVKRERNNALLAVQSRVSHAISVGHVGGEFDVMVEGLSRAERKRRGVDVKPGTGMVSLTLGGREMDDRALLTPGVAVAGVAVAEDERVQMSARTEGDCIVFFDMPAAEAEGLIGRVVRCRVTAADGLGLRGELV